MTHSGQLTAEERIFTEALYLLTGQGDRVEPLEPLQVQALRAMIPAVQAHDINVRAACDLLNRILLTLVIRPMQPEFFSTVFKGVHLDEHTEVSEAVGKFRTLCMLEHGNFRYGYKFYNQNTMALKESWLQHFPDAQEEALRLEKLKARPEPAGLVHVPEDRLFALGYIAYERAPVITEARAELKPILEEAVRKRSSDWASLVKIGRRHGKNDVSGLLERAALPDAELLVGGDLFLHQAHKKFRDVLAAAAEYCVPVADDDIHAAQGLGLQNTATYLAMHDLDVYVATSMRDPVHFTSNSAFVRRLFHEGILKDYGIRYFDPTQSFMEDRIQKGLLECLMIKRAALTVYNAQESDTFGKDSELGVTLAQKKPAILYVSRFFDLDTTAQAVYSLIDRGTVASKGDFIESALKESAIPQSDAQMLRAPEKTRSDVIRAIISHAMKEVLESIPVDQIRAELLRHGYTSASSDEATRENCLRKIALLESRANTFKDIHPLSLQTSPLDGVARGVYVTRSVEQTARLVRNLLVGAVRYEIKSTDANWLLCEQETGSPVRVVTKNRYLTAAFWSETWGGSQIPK